MPDPCASVSRGRNHEKVIKMKTVQQFFSTNEVDAVAHCLAHARKMQDSSQFGFGRNDAADQLVSKTISSVYSAIYSHMQAKPEWLGTHKASLENRELAAMIKGSTTLQQCVATSTFPDRDYEWVFTYLFGEFEPGQFL